jgi:hypothetical protein
MLSDKIVGVCEKLMTLFARTTSSHRRRFIANACDGLVSLGVAAVVLTNPKKVHAQFACFGLPYCPSCACSGSECLSNACSGQANCSEVNVGCPGGGTCWEEFTCTCCDCHCVGTEEPHEELYCICVTC